MRAACALLLLLVACSDNQTCNTVSANLGDLCLPGTLAPDLAAVVDVREACGPGCTDTPTCSAVFTNGQIVLQTSQDVCPATTQTAPCLDMGCQQRIFPCTLPALPAGDYTMTVPGGPPRSLHFAPGGAASCRMLLPDGGVP
jgi:hypothetical protein